MRRLAVRFAASIVSLISTDLTQSRPRKSLKLISSKPRPAGRCSMTTFRRQSKFSGSHAIPRRNALRISLGASSVEVTRIDEIDPSK